MQLAASQLWNIFIHINSTDQTFVKRKSFLRVTSNSPSARTLLHTDVHFSFTSQASTSTAGSGSVPTKDVPPEEYSQDPSQEGDVSGMAQLELAQSLLECWNTTNVCNFLQHQTCDKFSLRAAVVTLWQFILQSSV